MAEIPDFVTHYYLADRQPFLTLSELELDEGSAVFEELKNRHEHDSRYRRRYGSGYLATRRKIESRLWQLFMSRGGKPKRKYPFYFVLGECSWFKGLVEEHREIRIAIDRLNPETISFTYPDSYVALSREGKPYYGKVFLLSELRSVVDRYGLPEDTSPADYRNYWTGDFEKYIEVQLWDNETIQPFIDQYLSTEG